MSFFKAFQLGIKRLIQFKKYIFIVYALNLMLASVLGSMLISEMQSSIGSSITGDNLRTGFDDLWYRNFQNDASAIAKTFSPSVTGIGAILNGMETFLKGDFFEGSGGIIGFGFLYWGSWIFLSAGFISLYLRGNPEIQQKGVFFKEASNYFPSFIILALISGTFYLVIFSLLLSWLNDFSNSLTREMIDERQVFYYTLGKYAIIWILVYTINIIFDYSKIVTISKNLSIKTVIDAPKFAIRFILKNPFKTLFLFALTSLLFLAIFAFYWLIAPGAWQSSWFTIVFAFLIGQVYILSRIAMKCLYYAGAVSLYQFNIHKTAENAIEVILQETG